MAYISGPYVCYYLGLTGSGGSAGGGPSYIGSTQAGWEVRETMHNRPVQDDLFGLARPDAIAAGADYEVTGLSVEFDKLGTSGLLSSQIPLGYVNTTVGYRMRDLAGSLYLLPKPFTPAATLLGAGNCYCVYSAAIANDITIMLSSALRECPVTFFAFPVSNTSYFGGTAINQAYGIVPTIAGVVWPTGF